MQRMLTGLVLVLFVAVIALGISVYELSQRTGAASPRTPPSSRSPTLPFEPGPENVAAPDLTPRIRQLEEEIAALKRELRARPAVSGTGPLASGGGGTGEGDPRTPAEPGVRPRDLNGDFVITEEDVAYYQKVQEKVVVQQRIDSTTSSLMRRIDTLATRGDIAPLADDRRKEVERILRKYVTSGEEAFGRYRRTGEEDTRGLTPEQRREELIQARTQLVASAQAELEPLLGAADSKKIADESLERQWGLGLGRPGRRIDGQR